MKYLFLCIPQWTGSNYIRRRIANCDNAITIEPGQKLFTQKGLGPQFEYVSTWALHPEIYGNENNYKWNDIKKLFHDHWSSDPRYGLENSVLVENSQMHPIRAWMLNKYFENPYFVFSVRNPYGYCLGKRANPNKKELAKQWVAVCDLQLKNRKMSNSIFFRYEDLCENTKKIENAFREFIPELKDLSFDDVKNGNRLYEKKNIDIVNSVIKDRPDLMKEFNYEFI